MLEKELEQIENFEQKMNFNNSLEAQIEAKNKQIDSVIKALNGKYSESLYNKLNALNVDLLRLNKDLEARDKPQPVRNSESITAYM